MNSFIKANPNRCIGCRTCQAGCVVAHEGMKIFVSDPDAYYFHPKLHVIKTAAITVPVQCHHCEVPPCKDACLESAIYQEDNRVMIDNSKCIGCKNCIVACPFGILELVESDEISGDGEARKLINKCDLCKGREDGPACVEVCPMDALEIVTEDSILKTIEQKRKNAMRI